MVNLFTTPKCLKNEKDTYRKNDRIRKPLQEATY